MTDLDGGFVQLCERATGHAPYDYQRAIADGGLPELLRVPTGGGKTLAAVLPWLFRRRLHPDAEVRAATPRWLVFALPMRVLVEQTHNVIAAWLTALGMDREVGLHRLMGGDGHAERSWRDDPAQDSIIVGTMDMLLSRALNRGYADTRWVWPIDFGLLNNGTQWVFDEVQLMDVGLPTSRQLQGLREALGTIQPTHSMWMSATIDQAAMATPDRRTISAVVEVTEADREGPLAGRLHAAKTVQRLAADSSDARALGALLIDHHRAGTRTIAVLNTVDRATDLYRSLRALGAPAVLVHSRFRPPERATHLQDALSAVDPDGPGTIVVSTQVLEAGVDLTSSTLFTEAAPWPSIVQRAGRCNRYGDERGAVLLWAPPPKAPPYDEADIAGSVEALTRLEGVAVTPDSLPRELVPTGRRVLPMLRRRDVLDLFDTTADLTGNDVDVGRFIRQSDDLDAHVAWWDVASEGPEDRRPLPGRDERCPVPVGDLRQHLKRDDRLAWRVDPLDRGRSWIRCRAGDIRPGTIVVLPASAGAYSVEFGWSRSSKGPVPFADAAGPGFPPADDDEGVGDDPVSLRRHWLALLRHLEDVEAEAVALLGRLDLGGVSRSMTDAVRAAARLHDIGKVHPCFQEMLVNTADGDAERAAAEVAGSPLAKSGGSLRVRNARRHFRHELASALALLDGGSSALAGLEEPDLAIYLVAAHHGRVRLGFRSLPDECVPGAPATALGIHDGDVLPAVDTPGGHIPETVLDLGYMGLGTRAGGGRSWSARALELRDRPDLGPFRLGFFETVVRLADWRASAEADERDDTATRAST